VALACSCNWNAQLLDVLRCGLMATLEDDRAEIEDYPLWNWQPVKIISRCRCYALKLLLSYSCSLVQNWLMEGLCGSEYVTELRNKMSKTLGKWTLCGKSAAVSPPSRWVGKQLYLSQFSAARGPTLRIINTHRRNFRGGWGIRTLTFWSGGTL